MNFAEEIKYSLTLTEVVETYTGESFVKNKMKCPFHTEKTASFTAFQNNTFYCFGCGATGDIFDFVKKFHNINFGQALVRLNTDFALHLPITGKVDKNATINARREYARKREAEALKRHNANKEYWLWFDRLLYLEKTVEKCKPKSPDKKTDAMFFVALNWIPYTKYRLSLAEYERRRLCG